MIPLSFRLSERRKGRPDGAALRFSSGEDRRAQAARPRRLRRASAPSATAKKARPPGTGTCPPEDEEEFPPEEEEFPPEEEPPLEEEEDELDEEEEDEDEDEEEDEDPP